MTFRLAWNKKRTKRFSATQRIRWFRAMPEGTKEARLVALRRQLEALERGRRSDRSVLPFALPSMDAALPGGGLVLGVLHELWGAGLDEEDGAVAGAFLAGILARIEPTRPVLWCLAGVDLHAPGLALCGLAPERLILARCRNDREILWAMEEGLASPALAAVVGEPAALSVAAARRLQLAAESSDVTAFVVRRWRDATTASRQKAAPSIAVTRWRITALPGALDAGEPGVGRPRWQVELLRCRGGEPAIWQVEACDATGHVSLAAELAYRPTAAPRRLALTG